MKSILVTVGCLALFTFLISTVLCYTDTAADDEILYLPGLPYQPKFKHYSGYLQVTPTRFLHYWFVESQSSPEKDPLVLWMNGGPGCSSLDGLLSEHGPYLATNTGGLEYNPYAWNTIANVLYLEAPAGVGFSYDITKDWVNNDDLVADQNYIALQQFFLKFPHLLKNDFYISGESYAGIYVPSLSVRVVQNATIRFKGILVGNGLSSYSINSNSLLYFANFHGLFGQNLWNDILSSCCPGLNDTEVCPFDKNANRGSCGSLVSNGMAIIERGLNQYNLYSSCYPSAVAGKREYGGRFHAFDMGHIFHFNRLLHGSGVRMDPDCTNSTAITTYLNEPHVRQAIHVSDLVDEWQVCSDDVYSKYGRTYSDMYEFYNKLLSKVRILIYNGDIDMACNFLGDEWFFDALKLQVVDERRAWLFPDADGSQQIGGFTKSWANGLTYATIRGAGHMVPQDKPIPSLRMFAQFLNNKPL